ncbi:MAG: hypothetical protein IJD92_01750 [Bacilli bacterium]|nr:hypothetical protein [Bacilli bacterium]
MKNEEKQSKFKENYSKLKEAWKDPRKKAGIKLLCYLIFFLLFIILAYITDGIDNTYSNNNKTTTTTKLIDNYNDKQENLLNKKHNINYKITIDEITYTINGTLENNIINGYLESNEGIKKIILKNETLYEINNNEEILLESSFDIKFLNLNYIIKLIKENRAYIKDLDNIKTYEYSINIDDIITKIYIETDTDNINKIDIKYNEITYNLTFDN